MRQGRWTREPREGPFGGLPGGQPRQLRAAVEAAGLSLWHACLASPESRPKSTVYLATRNGGG
eukprot:scaffold305052_cov31-Tisochrysis_lutea.AAC.1